MSVTLAYSAQVSVTETIENTPTSSSPSITHSAYNTTQNLTGATTPPVTKIAGGLATLSAGALTLDLTALTGTNGAAVTFSGLKVQAFKFKNKAANTGAMTLTEGAANGYELAGNTWKMVLAPGQEFLFFGNDAAPDVGGAAKTIDITGTGTEAGEFVAVAG
jgi:hypothetical protein